MPERFGILPGKLFNNKLIPIYPDSFILYLLTAAFSSCYTTGTMKLRKLLLPVMHRANTEELYINNDCIDRAISIA